MKVIVIGLGSMGKRRIRLLKNNFMLTDIIGIDANTERKRLAEAEFGILTYSGIEEVERKDKYNVVFVCTPPLSHNAIIDECLERELNVFTEINLVADGYDELVEKARDKNCTLFLSSTMLYRREIEYIRQTVKKYNGTLNYNYHVGQYLPDWHPWEHYKDFFVNEKRTNGCRELFAIELPWIIETFGEIKDILVQKSKMTSLDLGYEDNYIVTIVHESGHKGVLMVDIVSRKAIRKLELMGEELYLTWEGTPQLLKEYDFELKEEKQIHTYEEVNKNNNYSENIIENAYIDEIRNFIDVLNEKDKSRYSFEKDEKILSIIDQIEK